MKSKTRTEHAIFWHDTNISMGNVSSPFFINCCLTFCSDQSENCSSSFHQFPFPIKNFTTKKLLSPSIPFQFVIRIKNLNYNFVILTSWWWVFYGNPFCPNLHYVFPSHSLLLLSLRLLYICEKFISIHKVETRSCSCIILLYHLHWVANFVYFCFLFFLFLLGKFIFA